MNKVIILFFVLFFSINCFSAVRVAFLTFYKWDGQPWILEPNGKYSHIAIEVEGGWLHAHPRRGVELISFEELAKLGAIKEIITVKKKEIKFKNIKKYLHLPYDSKFNWSSRAFYCSELVAKILKIKPEPMDFSLEHWPEYYQRFNGKPGLSPDDLYLILTDKKRFQCGKLF